METVKDFIITHTKPTSTYQVGAYFLKNEFERLGMEYIEYETFIDVLGEIGYKLNKKEQLKLALVKQ
jgi:hypothetical protein